MGSRNKRKRGDPPQHPRPSGKRRNPNALLWIVLAAVVLLMIFLFVGNYMYGPKQPLKP